MDPCSERLSTKFALYPMTADEEATSKAILDQEGSAGMLMMPTHHVSQHGDLMGFRYECGAAQPASALPIVRSMFFGHTAVECLDDDGEIMRLMADCEGNRRMMRDFLHKIAEEDNPPDLDCIPDNATVLTHAGLMQATDLRSIDCKSWSPELPESIGLYHAYIRGYNRDVRTHKLFIVCSGGCNKASDQFCNLLIDVGDKWTAGEVADSEEAWWLRRACQRARCRLIKRLADAFGVQVHSVEDVLAHPMTAACGEGAVGGGAPRQVLQAVPTTDTIEHDLTRRDTRFVTVYNAAVDTTKVTNGILCSMQPSEGVWLFRGAPRGTGVYGAMFGSHQICGAFPTRSPLITGRHPNTLAVLDGTCVVRAGQGGGATPAEGQAQGQLQGQEQRTPRSHQHGGALKRQARYVCFDEAFFKNLEKMQWNRDNGYIELIPIVVGMP